MFDGEYLFDTCIHDGFFFNLYAFILLTSTIVQVYDGFCCVLCVYIVCTCTVDVQQWHDQNIFTISNRKKQCTLFSC